MFLQVQTPNVLTRVSEYVPEIIQCTEGIIKNGFAYESNGSVYFDTQAFISKHSYPKLEPWSIGNAKLHAEGEGALSATLADKKHRNDFALWKKSKEDEPKWNSPWGEGRPGWHIECSAMANDILGDSIDIHSGGEDLRFPHHDNEIAQSEAYFANDQWINYFIHSGHLHIDGCKMAKSQKNFITIKQALAKYDGRQIRMLFLLHKYDAIMDYSTSSMEYAIQIDKQFSEFFHTIKAILRNQQPSDEQRWSQKEKEINQSLLQTTKEVHEALADNFNTSLAIQHLSGLVKKTNIYMSETKAPRAYVLNAIASYITQMFNVFGLIDNLEIGYSSSSGGNREDLLKPYLDAFTEFRSNVRVASFAKDVKKVLEACDSVRDEMLPNLGVRLYDTTSEKSDWKYDDPEEIKKSIQLKKELEVQKRLEKEERARQQKEKLEKGKILPEELFKLEANLYSKFDEKGIPTHDKDGKELTKTTMSKLRKQYESQVKLNQSYLKSLSSQDNNTQTQLD